MTETYVKNERVQLYNPTGGLQNIVRTTVFNKETNELIHTIWSEEVAIAVPNLQDLTTRDAAEMFPELITLDINVETNRCPCCGGGDSVVVTGLRAATEEQVTAAKKRMDLSD